MISPAEQVRILDEFVLPLFSGAELVGAPKPSTARENTVALSDNNMVVKFNKEADKRYEIRRSQPFANKDVKLVRYFVDALAEIEIPQFYSETIYNACMEKAICCYIADERTDSDLLVMTVKDTLDSLTNWSLRTYEGKHLAFGIVIDNNNSPPNANSCKITDFLNQDYSAPLSDGITSCLVINRHGCLMQQGLINELYVSSSERRAKYAPFRFIDFASICNYGRIGISLLPNGEILIFNNLELLFSRRQGKWRIYDHKNAIQRLAGGTKTMDEMIRESMYLTALDVSFARTGGCIGYIDKTQVARAVDKIISSEDILNSDEEKSSKALFIDTLIKKRKFQELDRKLRQELAGIDGATVIDESGNLLACGTILKEVLSSIDGGGRLAATKQLALYGAAIKISADGGIRAFRKEKETVSVG